MKGQLMIADVATMSRRRHLQLTSRGMEQMAEAIQLFFPEQQDLLYRQDDEGLCVAALTGPLPDDSPWRVMSAVNSAMLIAEDIQSWLEGLDYREARRLCGITPMNTDDNPQLDGFSVASSFKKTGRGTGYHYLAFIPAWI